MIPPLKERTAIQQATMKRSQKIVQIGQYRRRGSNIQTLIYKRVNRVTEASW